jgi:AcrR family transcriptional regulator
MAIGVSDLTAAARIRDAALRQFAGRGVAATSIRDVAKAAGVSSGLVQHHFRSKARLRRAVEEFVVHRAIAAFGQPTGSDSPAESSMQMGARISAFIRANPAVFAYVGRSILEGDAAGLELFERFLALARAQLARLVTGGLLRSDLDRDWAALHVVLIDVGAYLLEPALSRYLGEPLLSEKGLKRMQKATEALFLKGIYRQEERRRRTRRPRR